MNKKNILLALLILGVVVLTIAGAPANAVYAAYDQSSIETHVLGLPGYPALELSGIYWVDFIDATTESALLQRGGECPTPCNTGGEGEGYTLFIGYGDSHADCWDDAEHYEQEYMTEEQREIVWASTGACRAPELGQTACVWYCCQPIPELMYFGWRYWEPIEE